MTTEREYQELYDRLLDEVRTLHRNNRRRIRNGMRMLLVVTVGLMLLMFLAQGNKVFTLMLWIFSMFAVAAYLIAVEYADYELQKKLEQVTQMELESMGALLELPELPRMPRLPDRRSHGRREETAADIVIKADPAAEEEPQVRRKRQEPRERQGGGAADGAQLLESLLRDPEKLAGDLELLTRALQGLSDDLRRSAAQQKDGEADR